MKEQELKKRCTKKRSVSPETTAASSNCSNEEVTASLDGIVEMDGETAAKTLSCDEDSTTGDDENDDEETTSGKDTVLSSAPVGMPAICGLSEWLALNDINSLEDDD